jgi:signal recognition particle GTPase
MSNIRQRVETEQKQLREQLDAKQKSETNFKQVMFELATLAKRYKLIYGVGTIYHNLANQVAKEHPYVKKTIKRDTRDSSSGMCFAKFRSYFVYNTANDVIVFDSFNPSSISLLDNKYLDLAEQIETILITADVFKETNKYVYRDLPSSFTSVEDDDEEPEEESHRQFWRCTHCTSVNKDEDVTCHYCSAPRT